MAMKLEKVVPFGRCFEEYRKMFNLSESDLKLKILGVGDGPASFNAEGTRKGYQITSIDPVYQFNGVEIRQRFNEVVDGIIAQVRATPHDWVWSYHKSPDDLKNNRLKTLETFLQDYDLGKQQRRYLVAELPTLPFDDQQYDLGLCSHFLFLYSAHYDLKFHIDSLLEMLRVCSEVRVFPLLTLALESSPYVAPVMAQLEGKGFKVSCETVDYEFQKGGNQMLRIKVC